MALSRGAFACVRVAGPEGAPDIVIVPPLGIPSEALAPFLALLAARLHVVAVDLPGSGCGSGASAGSTTRDLGHDLLRALDRARVSRAHLFGISLGGMIAQWAAVDGGDRFERVVLASTAARGLDAALAGPAAKLALARRLLLSREPGKSLARGIVSAHVRHDADAMHRIESAIDENPHDVGDLVWLAAAAARHDARGELGRITAPSLVISGRADSIVPAALQDELEAAIPGARRAWIEGAGHDVTLDQPARTADAVLGFLFPYR